jgi:ribosomal protein S6--L-glutamate ligase
MKLGILSTAPNCYSTRRLREAAAGRGHLVKVLNTLRSTIDLSSAQPRLQYRGKTLSPEPSRVTHGPRH